MIPRWTRTCTRGERLKSNGESIAIDFRTAELPIGRVYVGGRIERVPRKCVPRPAPTNGDTINVHGHNRVNVVLSGEGRRRRAESLERCGSGRDLCARKHERTGAAAAAAAKEAANFWPSPGGREVGNRLGWVIHHRAAVRAVINGRDKAGGRTLSV